MRACELRLRPDRDRLGAGRPEGGSPGREARQAGRGRRAWADRRRLGEHGHDSLQDVAGGRRLPHRPEPARHLRSELPGQGGDHSRGPGGAHALGDRARGRHRPGAAHSQPGRDPVRDGELRGSAHDRRAGLRRGGAARERRQRRHRLRAPGLPIRRGWSSTAARSWTRTACSSSPAFPLRSSWSAPG